MSFRGLRFGFSIPQMSQSRQLEFHTFEANCQRSEPKIADVQHQVERSQFELREQYFRARACLLGIACV